MNTLTPHAKHYIEVFKNSFLKDEDYDYFMKWLSHKINHNESMNKGIIMYSPGTSYKDFCIDMFENINPKLCNYSDKTDGKMLFDKYSIIKVHHIDDVIKRRIEKCYKYNTYECYKMVSNNENNNEKYSKLIESKNKCDWYISINNLSLIGYDSTFINTNFKIIERCPIYKKSELEKCPYANKILFIEDGFKLFEDDIVSIYNYIEEYEDENEN